MNAKNKIIPRLAAVVMAASLFSSVFAADGLSRSDRKFLEHASKKEVAISQDVLTKLSNPQVKEFAHMMVTQHTAANAELIDLAARKGVAVPELNSKTDRKWAEKTKNIDEDYVEAMVDTHEDAVDEFEKATKSDDAEIAAFARKTLPTLQQHLATVKGLKKTVD